MTLLLPLGILLLANLIYCGIKIKEDVSRKRRGWATFGIAAALGTAAVVYWVGCVPADVLCRPVGL